jgi:hypothetical protein
MIFQWIKLSRVKKKKNPMIWLPLVRVVGVVDAGVVVDVVVDGVVLTNIINKNYKISLFKLCFVLKSYYSVVSLFYFI